MDKSFHETLHHCCCAFAHMFGGISKRIEGKFRIDVSQKGVNKL